MFLNSTRETRSKIAQLCFDRLPKKIMRNSYVLIGPTSSKLLHDTDTVHTRPDAKTATAHEKLQTLRKQTE